MKNSLRKDDIDLLFKKGKWIKNNCISAIYMPSDSFVYMVSAPIKKFKRAVDRNYIKRVMRSSIDSHSKISIAFIYTSTSLDDTITINNSIKEILNKFDK
jgi:ribonuclease P protein component